MPTRHIALLGGSFDPPHRGHAALAEWALESGEVDEVWFLPCRRHPFGKPLSPWADRLAMCEAVCASLSERMRVEPIEIEIGSDETPSYTVDTVAALQGRHPEVQFRLLGGSDLAVQLDQWREAERLKSMAPPLLAPRRGHETESVPGKARLPEISSSQIREILARGEEIGDLVIPAVESLIAARGLYQSSSS